MEGGYQKGMGVGSKSGHFFALQYPICCLACST